MVKYLQMDGVDDHLKTATSLTITEVVMDIAVTKKAGTQQRYWGLPFGAEYLQWNGTTSQDNFTAGIQVFVNDIQQTTGTNFVPSDTRITLKIKAGSAKSGINYIFNNNGSTLFFGGKIYDLKFYNGATLQAHYDMNTGTVQDQSGKGNHGTLSGGTWVDDGTGGGEPVGTDGSISLVLTQQIYSDSSVNLSLTQSIYADISANLDLIQAIYKDSEAVLNLTQAIYQESENSLNLRQEMYAEAESIVNLIQEFYEDSQTYITLQLIQQIYKDSSTDLPMIQTIYQDSEIGLPLRQEMYEEKENILSLTQNVYKDDMGVLNLSQIIYRDNAESLNLVQQMYAEGEISLPLLIQIRDDLINLIGIIRLIGKRVLNIPLQGQRILNVTLKGGIDVTAVNQNFSMVAGDTKNLVVSMPEDLTGCTVKWGLRQRAYSTENILSKSTADGISISGTEITIKLSPVDTESLAGTFYHECEVTDQQTNVSTIFTGMATISRSAI